MSRHSAAPDLATKQSAGSAYRARSCDHHDTRNDLLFTMSDITRLSQSRGTRAHGSIMRRNANDVCLDEPPDWWSQTGSNRRPPACKAGALPAELWPRTTLVGLPIEARGDLPVFALQATPGNLLSLRERRLVGLGRFELPTSRLSSARSNQLSYKPVIRFLEIARTGRIVAPCDLPAFWRIARDG